MKLIAVLLFIIGLNLAGSDGPFFPSINLLGLGSMFLSLLLCKGFIKLKGGYHG